MCHRKFHGTENFTMVNLNYSKFMWNRMYLIANLYEKDTCITVSFCGIVCVL